MATKSKSKTEKKTEAEPETKTKKSKKALDLSWLGDRGEKRAAHFLERASDKRQVDAEKILAACLHYCATLSQKRHGIHYVLQDIEQTTRCKIK